jgi:argininosuccinate lyase
LVSHYLMAHQEMLKRDQQRLSDLTRRINVMPLGSAALAGAGLPVDMEFVAEGLGFEEITDNSLDAVADRDYLIEFLSAASIIMMHLSRFCEDLILWATSEFDFVDLPDELCTGSSIMPQKKNPDALELTRGKTGRVYGHLMGMLTVMKGLPLAYNRDLQEDKEPLFDTVHTLAQALPLTALLVEKTAFKPEVMYRAADDSFALATDLADHLVRQGVPFRRAHAQVGAAVRHCLERGVGLTDLTAEEIQKLCPGAGENVKDALTVSASAAARDNPGGTARQRVEDAVRRALEELKK